MSAVVNEKDLIRKLVAVKHASAVLRGTIAEPKNSVLRRAAGQLKKRETEILQANAEDLREAATLKVENLSAYRDRLTLNPARITQMAESLLQVAALADPVGEIAEQKTLANGLQTRRVRTPLGVIFIIFESRPNVAVEAFSLGFKAGNGMILRGGKESMRTTSVLYSILTESLIAENLPADCLYGITDPDRAITENLLRQKDYIDVVVPRGGDGLIRYVTENTRIPVIKNDRGLCHVYVHEDADLEMARRIVLNAKTQRPGVCNSLETLLVHEKVAARFLPMMHESMQPFQLQWYCSSEALELLHGFPGVHPATAQSFDTEYLDFKISCRIVTDLDQALAHIEAHGSRHSESIITADSTNFPFKYIFIISLSL